MAASTSGSGQAVLYQTQGEWDLPSLNAGGLQAEAYLRFTGSDFAIERCPAAAQSPTGVLPALETDLGILPPPEDGSDLAAAASIVAHLQAHGRDLDAKLPAAQRAEALAFAALIEARIVPATRFTVWCEARGFQEYRKAAYKAVQFPLNWVLPWLQQREMRRQAGAAPAQQVYAGAMEALDALAAKLRASPGPYLLGAQPCSADAALFGHAAFYLHSPVAAPVLKSKVQSTPALAGYAESVLRDAFSKEVAPPPPLDDSAAYNWSPEAQGQPKPKKAPPTAEELRMRRGNLMWLGGAAAAVAGYVVLSGQYIQVLEVDDSEEVFMEEEDDDDDDGHDDAE